MRNHKCGTCRFYQEAQLASSGWCHHPQRKTTSDIMIMVRKNELACRDEWAHDLWEPKSAQPGTPATAPGQFGDRKERPATEAEIAAILAANSTSTNQDPQRTDAHASDIVLSELGAGPEPHTYVERIEPPRDWNQATSRSVEPAASSSPSADHPSTARGAIIRAREAYRERSRQEAARSQEIARLSSHLTPSAHLGSTTDNLPATDPVADPVADPVEETSVAAQSELPEPEEVHLEPEEPEADDIVLGSAETSAVQEAEGTAGSTRPFDDSFELPPDRPEWMDDLDEVANAHHPAADPDTASSSHIEPAATRLRFDDPFGFGYSAERERADTKRSGGSLFGRGDAARSRSSFENDQPQAADRYGSERQPSAESPRYWSASDQKGERLRQRYGSPHEDDLPTDTGVAYDNTDVDVFDEIATTAKQIDIEAKSEPETEFAYEYQSETDYVVADDSQQDVVIPLRPALSAHLPRICRTCRDFRPAETGDRGWCANPWAFSHRRVVVADEQAPCETVLGDWWLPADEVWADAADVSSHGQPTPLLDAWLPEYQEDQPSRRRS